MTRIEQFQGLSRAPFSCESGRVAVGMDDGPVPRGAERRSRQPRGVPRSGLSSIVAEGTTMRILVIGGTNFIGPHLVWRVVGRGHEVAVFHRGQAEAALPASVRRLRGDRHRLRDHRAEFARFGPDVVVDMIDYTEDDALGLVETFRGLARRAVVPSSGDVYRAYGRFLGIEAGPVEPKPLAEDAPLRSALFPYREKARGTDDFLYSYDKIPVERVVMAEPALPATVLRLPMTYGPGDPFGGLSPYLKRMDDNRPAIVLREDMARWKCPAAPTSRTWRRRSP